MKLSSLYVAGLFDGEGWVRVDDSTPTSRKTGFRFQLVVGIALTHKPVLELVHAKYGGKLYGDDSFRRKYAKNRTIYRWGCASKMAAAFLRDVAPHLIVKKDQADLAIHFQDHVDANQHKMVGNWKHDPAKHLAKLALREEIYAYRRSIADQLKALKKVNYNL